MPLLRYVISVRPLARLPLIKRKIATPILNSNPKLIPLASFLPLSSEKLGEKSGKMFIIYDHIPPSRDAGRVQRCAARFQ